MRDDALPVARLAQAGAAIALAVALAIAVVLALLAHRHVPVGGAAIVAPAPLPDGVPMLQADPQDDLARYRDQQQRALDGLGWADPASGVPHLPIRAAMALQAARAASAGASR